VDNRIFLHHYYIELKTQGTTDRFDVRLGIGACADYSIYLEYVVYISYAGASNFEDICKLSEQVGVARS
jgi:hypothetical protein